MASKRRGFVNARKTAGFTQESLAAELNVDRSTVIRWEAGDCEPHPVHWPNLARLLGLSADELRRLFAEPADKAARRAPPVAVLGQAPLGQAPPAAAPAAVELLNSAVPAVDRRAMLASSAAAALMLSDAEALRRELAQAVDHAAMADASLDDWEHTVHQYGLAVRYRPPSSLLVDLTADFAELSRLLERRRAILVPTRLTQIVGQMAGLMCATLVRLGQHAAARNWARTAKAVAKEAGDTKLHAWVLSQEGYSNYYDGNLVPAVFAAAQGQHVANQAPCAGVAIAAALDARARALLGRREESHGALRRLEQTLGRMNAKAVMPSIFDYDEARFHFNIGNAYTHLGETAAAYAAQDQALALYPASDYFDRTLILLDRAVCLVHDNDVPAAAECANQALCAIGPERRTPVLEKRARQVLDQIPAKAAGLPAVQELRDVLRDTATD